MDLPRSGLSDASTTLEPDWYVLTCSIGLPTQLAGTDWQAALCCASSAALSPMHGSFRLGWTSERPSYSWSRLGARNTSDTVPRTSRSATGLRDRKSTRLNSSHVAI